MRITLIHTPGAGSGEHSRESLLASLRAAGYDPAYGCSVEEHELERALQDPGGLVVVAGGDGTVDRVACRLAGSGVPLAILPMGTANNVASCLEVQGAPAALIEGWAAERRRALDVGTIRLDGRTRHFLEAAGTGLFPRLMDELRNDRRKETLGEEDELAYDRRCWLKRLKAAVPRPVDVCADGRDLSGSYLLVEAMNMRGIGPKAELAPEADPGDGWLDLVLVGEAEREEIIAYMEALTGGDAAPPALPVHRARSVRLRDPTGWFHIDDELCRGPTVAQIEILPHALEVLA